MAGTQTERVEDANGFITIERNPISRSGVFQYLGTSLPDADPHKIYNVLRPPEELSHPDTLKSLSMIPLINEHVMLGEGFDVKAEEKGVHGFTGQDVVYDHDTGIVYSPLRIVSDTLKQLIGNGKKGLSLGYRCVYEKASGVFNGQAYDYIQRKIRGNHIALVEEGRMGKDIAVLDHSFAFDSFDINRESNKMADEPKKEEEKKAGMTIEECVAILEKIMPQIEALNAALEKKADKPAEEATPAATDAEEEKKDKEDEKKAMDAALAPIASRLAAVEKRGTKELLAEVSNRDKLAKEVEQHVGTFDHAEMTTDEVAAYALGKLEIKAAKGHERATLDGYLAGRKAAGASEVGFAIDSKAKEGGLLSKRLDA